MNTTDRIKLQSGSILCEHGFKIKAGAFHIDPIEVSSEDIIKFAQLRCPGIQTGMMDDRLFITKLEPWVDYLEFNWLKTKKWVTNLWDCDNFSMYFSVDATLSLGVSSFRVYGQQKTLAGKLIGYHYWNAIITQEADGSKHLYFVEPQNSLMTEVKGDSNVVIGSGLYVPIKIYGQ